MTTAAMMRQLRILEIIIICYLAKTLEGKSVKTLPEESTNERAKRGFSHYGGNDFGSSAQVSSAVLQYSGGEDQGDSLDSGGHLDPSAVSADHSGSFDGSSLFDAASISLGHSGGLDTISHLDSSASNADSWSASGLSSGYDVWLEPLPNYSASSSSSSAADSLAVHTSSIASSHPGSDHIANAVFSDDSAQSAQFEMPSSQLHTQISSSSSIGSSAVDFGASIHDHGTVAISDNVDFNNVADLKSKHYTKSYGK